MRVRLLVVGALLISVSSSALSQAPGNRVADFARTDVRLKLPVTVEEDELYVGDLLERASAQTGVEMRCGRDGSADVRVTVFARAMPLDRLMRSLHALLSHRDAEVYWERDGKPGEYSYTLRFPQNARTLAVRLREEADTAFEKVVATMFRLADMAPELRRKHASEISRAYQDESDSFARRMTEDSKSDCLWAGLKLLRSVLSEQQQRDVLSNDGRVFLKGDELPPAGRQLLLDLHGTWRAAGAEVPDFGTRAESLSNEKILFFARRCGDDLIRSLIIQLSSIGGHGYAGGGPLEQAFRKRIRGLWMNSGDTETAPATLSIDQHAAALTGAPEHLGMLVDFPTPLQQRLRQFAAAAHVPILARISSACSQDPAPVGASLADFVRRVATLQRGLNIKWSGTTFLIEEPRWFLTAEHVPSWASIKWIRQLLVDRQGALTLADMCELTRQFSKEELDNSGLMKRAFGAIPGVWNLFRLLAEKPSYQAALLSESGLTLTDDVARSLQSCTMLADAARSPGVRALTLTIKPYKLRGAPETSEPDRTLYNFGWTMENGERRHFGGFLLRRTKPSK